MFWHAADFHSFSRYTYGSPIKTCTCISKILSVSSKAWSIFLSVPALFSFRMAVFPFFFFSPFSPPWACNIFNFGTVHFTLAGIQNALAGTKLLRDYCPAHPGLNLTIRNSICILKVEFIVTTTTAVDTVE